MEGLPNDHYHAYMDPVVIVLLALSARAIAGGSGAYPRVDVAARSVVAIALGALILLDLRLTPPADPNGGWPAARVAGERIVLNSFDGPFDVRQLPIFKTAEGVGHPVIVAGGEAVSATDRDSAARPVEPGTNVVIACDRLFEDVIGALCGGPAEDRYLERLGLRPALYVRFDQSPRISITVYMTPLR